MYSAPLDTNDGFDLVIDLRDGLGYQLAMSEVGMCSFNAIKIQ